ncbi:hypothetical protein JX266_010333 [Neoarthrinium moseri]|nr:hypothetical protein JX266_010333 [Neoarthrinium moseri]
MSLVLHAPAPKEADGTEKTSSPDGLNHAKNYAFTLGNRVKSFESEPLHSNAYLTYLARYLRAPFDKQHNRQQMLQRQNVPQWPFIVHYELQHGRRPVPTPYSDPEIFATLTSTGNEVTFLTGRPSAEWLNCVGAKYQLDHRFFHQHLGTILSGKKYFYSVPGLPSRSLQSLRLRVPTILFIGAQGRNVDIKGLETARDDCNNQLRKTFRSIQDSAVSEAGTSIIRNIDVYDGSHLVIQQEVTIYVVSRGEQWTGKSRSSQFTSTPLTYNLTTDHFAPVAAELEFCPVFFENNLAETQSMAEDQIWMPRCQHPTILLNSYYGATINWKITGSHGPLHALQELLDFNAAAISQYINMVEQVLADIGRPYEFPSYEHTKLEAILHYDYIKAKLSRMSESLTEALAFQRNPPTNWNCPMSASEQPDIPLTSTSAKSVEDFTYLLNRTKSLIAICDDGKATLMSNASVQDAKRSAAETRLVTQLTKATNRLTFIFLPISFVTSMFGMNFQEFGQGDMPLWIWAVITVPLLAICILLVERGNWLSSRFKKLLPNNSSHRS